MLKRFIESITLKNYRREISNNQRELKQQLNLIHDQLFLSNPILIVQEVKFYLPLFYVDHIQKIIYRDRNFYELETLQYLQKEFGEFKNILDVGSNIGNHMLYFCSKMQPKQVICFEPNPFNYSILCKNIELNNLEQIVTAYNFAIGEEQGRGRQRHFSTMNTGMNSIEASKNNDDTEVDIKPLDDLNLENIDFIKIDVEGFEVEVLKGAARTLKTLNAVVMVEVFPPNRKKVDDLMSSFGYSFKGSVEEYNLIYVR